MAAALCPKFLRFSGVGPTIALGLLAAACAHGPALSTQKRLSEPPPQPVEDPSTRVVREADAHLAKGTSELQAGHLNRAREEFDRAVDTYLTSPGGALSSERVADAYRRTLEEIHLRELEALAAGDGFTEKPAEPASIDDVGQIPVTEMPSEQTRRTAEEAVREEANDVPIILNDAVLSCIDLYQGRLRDWFENALARGGRYLPEIREILASEGVPQDLAYVALVESAFKTGALSRARAKGVWQFIPDTGRRFGLQQDWWVDERSDPQKATRAAARYLKELHELFGDWNLALAGYNAGEWVVQRAISRHGTTDFWALRRTRALRNETKNYVPLIHAAIVVSKAPDKYGFNITPEPELTFETVPVEGALDLRAIAECVGSSLDQIQDLNPELRRLATPANRTFLMKVPPGTGAALTSCIESLPAQRRVQFRTHVVARGQTFASIARQYSTAAKSIADANGLSLGRRLGVGAELIIPIDPRATVPPVRHASQEDVRGPVDPVRISYKIKPGDTLAAIASQYGTTVQDLQSWNGLTGTQIAAGHNLTIYKGRKF